MRKILALTGSRSDYGLMTPIYEAIAQDPGFQLEMIVTGQHLTKKGANYLSKIKKDKWADVYYTDSSLSKKETDEFFGSVIAQTRKIILQSKPYVLLLQGDRGEMLAAALAAVYHNIPIVHMSGGDYSGSVDDSIRNAISKLAHIHLVTCKKSAERLEKIAENPKRIFVVGEPVIDLIKKMNFISPEDLAREFNLDLSKPLILATQHPVVTESSKAYWQIKQTLQALEELNIQTIFTYPNNDPGSEEIITVLKSAKNKHIRVIPNLGSQKYLSLMRISSVIVGNSSSGIIEASSFKIPVVNIGTRQYGRLRTNNIIDVDYDKNQIKKAIIFCLENKNFKKILKHCRNPYGDGQTAQKTIKILKKLGINEHLLAKWLPYNGSFLEG